MNKKVRIIYIINCVATVLFGLSLLFNAFKVETTEHYSYDRYTISYKTYGVFEVINAESGLGLISVSFAAIIIGLIIAGLFIGTKKKKLSQSFISGGIICAFMQLNSVWLELQNTKNDRESKITYPDTGSLQNEIVNKMGFGYILCLCAVIAVIASTIILIYISFKKESCDKRKKENYSSTARYEKIIDLENLRDSGAITKEQFDLEIEKLVS